MSPKVLKIPRTRQSIANFSDEPQTSHHETVVNDASSYWHMPDGPVDAEQFKVAPTVAFRDDVTVWEEVSNLESGKSETAGCRLELPASDTYSNYEVVLTVISILSYIFDVGSDIYVAVVYYRDGDIWWFTLTVLFIVVPSLTITVFSFVWYLQDRSSHPYPLIWLPRLVLLFLQLGPLLRFVVYLVKAKFHYAVPSLFAPRPIRSPERIGQ